MEKVIPRPVPPCKECETREVGCHATCIRYKHYEKKRKEYNKAVRHEKLRHYPEADIYGGDDY